MLGGLIHLPEHEIDRIIDRVLTNERVEQIVRRITTIVVDELAEHYQKED